LFLGRLRLGWGSRRHDARRFLRGCSAGVGRRSFRVMAGDVGAESATVVGLPGRYAGARGGSVPDSGAGGSVPDGCVGADFAAAAALR
jgi:hypothetical protein